MRKVISERPGEGGGKLPKEEDGNGDKGWMLGVGRASSVDQSKVWHPGVTGYGKHHSLDGGSN